MSRNTIILAFALASLSLAGCTEIHTKVEGDTISVVATAPTLVMEDARMLNQTGREVFDAAVEKHCKSPDDARLVESVDTVKVILGVLKTILGMLPVHTYSETATVTCSRVGA